MEAKQRRILDLFSQPNTQFTIPVYQRDYNWQEKHCKLLFENIKEISKNKESISHFIGSIVYIHEGVYRTGTTEFSVIDGQQRITTLTLLFLAMCHTCKKNGNENLYRKIYYRYIIDEYMEKSSKLKLVPPEENGELLTKIVNEKQDELQNFLDRNLVKNYNFFMKELVNYKGTDLEELHEGLGKLIYVDIALEKGKDDPQKIFESLNSTGLDLSQSDLIRNYILMDLNREKQEEIFKKIWIPIENNCKISNSIKIDSYVSDFFRDYLTLKSNKIPAQGRVFEAFKEYYSNNEEFLDDVLEEIKIYSGVYELLLKPEKENDKELGLKLKYLKALEQSVVNPFLMGIIKDYKDNILEKETLIKMLEILESYIWRRYATAKPSNRLNKIFMNLHTRVREYSKIQNEDYYNSLLRILLKHDFPKDDEVKAELRIRPVYKDRNKLNYVFQRLENHYHNEIIDFENDKITIEHIFPRKPNKYWSESMSKEEFEQMKTLKDTISNLTLTGSNSNLSNKLFIEKRDEIPHGYGVSKLYMNSWLGKQGEWNISKMNERFEILYNDIINIWKRPQQEGEVDNVVFFIIGNGFSGSGKLKSNNKFLILKGSSLIKNEKIEPDKGIVALRNELISKNIIKETERNFVFEEEYLFSSPSAAAKFIIGKITNGWKAWRSYEGKLLDDYREK